MSAQQLGKGRTFHMENGYRGYDTFEKLKMVPFAMTQIAKGIIKLSYNIFSKPFISFHMDIYLSHYYHFYLCDYLIHA